MSWSVQAVGKPAAVAAKLAKDFTNIKCAEPEESIKFRVSEIIAIGLAAFPPDMAVSVVAGGSQFASDSRIPGEFINSLKIDVTPLYGFVE